MSTVNPQSNSNSTSPKSSSPKVPPSKSLVEPLDLSSIKNTNTNNNTNNNTKSNNPQRFLPKQLVIGSPFYQDSNSSFSNDLQTPLLNKFKTSLNDCINEDDENDINNNINDNELKDHNESSNISIITRSLKFLNLPLEISLSDILNLINFGPIEFCDFELNDESSSLSNSSSHSSPTKGLEISNPYRSIIVSFIDSFTANKCYNQLISIIDDLKINLNSENLNIIKIKSPLLSNYLKNEINNNGASRALCLSNLNNQLSEEIIFNELSYFGEITNINYNINKNSCFVHFNSILNAIKCFNQLPLCNSILSNSIIFYSNDRKINLSSSISFLDTFNDLNDLNSLKRNNIVNENYSISSTSISSRRESTDNKQKNTITSKLINSNRSIENISNETDVEIDVGSRSNSKNTNNNNNNNTNQDHNLNKKSQQYYNKFNKPTFHKSFTFSPYQTHYDTSFSSNSITPIPITPYSHNNIYNLKSFSFSDIPSERNISILNQNNINNRTIYLGNLAFNTTAENICNTIRGGMLENIKVLTNKNAAFITFLYHEDAAQFIAKYSIEKIIINHKYLNIGWGKNSGNLHPVIKEAVDQGASRNLYIGINEDLETENDYDFIIDEKLKNKLQNNNEDFENEDIYKKVYKCIPNENELRRDFSIFGEIEQINYFKNGACVFINFTNILSCIKAINDFNFNGEESIYLHESFNNKYKNFIISYGKDRCANPPKKKSSKKNKKKLISKNNDNRNNSFSYMSIGSNYSVDTDFAIKFDSAFEGMGISSPSAKKKSSQIKNKQFDIDDSDVDDDEVEIEISVGPEDTTNNDRNDTLEEKDEDSINRRYSNNSISRSTSTSSFQPMSTPTPNIGPSSINYETYYSQGNNYMITPQPPYYYSNTPTFPPQTPTNEYGVFPNNQFVYQYVQPMYYGDNGNNNNNNGKNFKGKRNKGRRSFNHDINNSFNQSFT